MFTKEQVERWGDNLNENSDACYRENAEDVPKLRARFGVATDALTDLELCQAWAAFSCNMSANWLLVTGECEGEHPFLRFLRTEPLDDCWY